MTTKTYSRSQINHSFKYLLFSRGLRSISLNFIGLALPLYLIFIFNQNLLSIGIIYFAIIGFNAIITLLSGMLSDRIGFKNGLIITELLPIIGICGFVLSTFFNFGVFVFGVFAMFAGITSAGGLRSAFSTPQTGFIANNWRDSKERVKKIGLITAVGSFAAIVGSLIIIIEGSSVVWLTSYFKISITQSTLLAFRYFFIFSEIMMIGSLLSLLFLKEIRRIKKKSVIIKNKSKPQVFRVMFAQFFSGVGIGLVFPILPALIIKTYVLNAIQGPIYIGYIYSFAYLATALSSLYISKKINHINIDRIAFAALTRVLQGLIVVIIATVLILTQVNIYVTLGIISVGILIFLYNILLGIGAPVRQSVNIDNIERDDYGTSIGMMSLSSQLPQASAGISGFLSEFIVSVISLPLFAGGLLISLSGIVYWKLLKKNAKNKNG